MIIIPNSIDINSHYHYYLIMYVCICNSITSKKIEKAVSNGISDTKNIYSYYNCSPKCGKCISYMEDLINNKTMLSNSSN